MGLWFELPLELLDIIDKHFMIYVGRVRFRAACTSWNTYLPKLPYMLSSLLQPLHNDGEQKLGLLNLAKKEDYELELPEAQGKLLKGSYHGWDVVTTEDIPSTSPPDVKEYHADKVGKEYATFYTDRFDDFFLAGADFVAVAIYGGVGGLAYCSCSDKKWTALPVKCSIKDPITKPTAFEDIIFHKGKLHALNCLGQLVVYEDIGVDPNVREIVPAQRHHSTTYLTTPMYLVESSDGGLLLVGRDTDVDDGKCPCSIVPTCGFRVYKLDKNTSNWVEVKSIGDDVLFVGCNSSISLSSFDYPRYQRNCIYFIDGPISFYGKYIG